MYEVLPDLKLLLQVAAILQLALAIFNLGLVRLMKWKDDLNRMPLLIREVFQIHCWFISLVLAIFGVMTWRFAAEMASGANAALTWLAAGIAAFWGLRAVLQVTYYSSSHWRGRLAPTLAHIGCLVVYGGWCFVYLVAAYQGSNL